MKIAVRYIVLLLGFMLIVSCSLFPFRNEPTEILIKGEKLTLAWGPPEYVGSYAGSELAYYKVYYRTRGAEDWIKLKDIHTAENLSLTVTNEDLDYGYYEFAVSAVDYDDNESPLHASTDTSADPITGWYVNWIGSR
jgi:hypothetical protein